VESAELAEVEEQIAHLKDEERRAARRKKKRELKEKQKRAVRLNLKMIIPGDEGPTASEEGLFRFPTLVPVFGTCDTITRVSDPDQDPYWIRIQSGQYIRIRIRIRIRIQESKNDHKKKN
jgi:hypothetical protein